MAQASLAGSVEQNNGTLTDNLPRELHALGAHGRMDAWRGLEHSSRVHTAPSGNGGPVLCSFVALGMDVPSC